eukprot:TRINITY_DN8382_c0_g1_i1.p1 TRINITY_DN8382_c0_g1~~TRINITY_DN8382_c0_g1_i1.p1  ORF type:complete len:662 (+),score=301.37 TRINITY_DN8382_c0_g1_i1:42-1988(+)
MAAQSQPDGYSWLVPSAAPDARSVAARARQRRRIPCVHGKPRPFRGPGCEMAAWERQLTALPAYVPPSGVLASGGLASAGTSGGLSSVRSPHRRRQSLFKQTRERAATGSFRGRPDPLRASEDDLSKAAGGDSHLPCCTLSAKRRVFARLRRGVLYRGLEGCFSSSARNDNADSGFEYWSRWRLGGNRWRVPGWDAGGEAQMSRGFERHGADIYTEMTMRYLQRTADLQRLEADYHSCRCLWWSVLGFVVFIGVLGLAAVPEEDVSAQALISQLITGLLVVVSSAVTFLAVVWQSEALLQTGFVFGIWQLSVFTAYFGWVVTHSSTVTDVCGPSVIDNGRLTAEGCPPAVLRYALRLSLSVGGFAVAVLQATDCTALWDALNDDEFARKQAVLFRYIEYWAWQLHGEGGGAVMTAADMRQGRCSEAEVGVRVNHGYEAGTGRPWDRGRLQADLFDALTARVYELERRAGRARPPRRRRRPPVSPSADPQSPTAASEQPLHQANPLEELRQLHAPANPLRQLRPQREWCPAEGERVQVRYDSGDGDAFEGWFEATVTAVRRGAEPVLSVVFETGQSCDGVALSSAAPLYCAGDAVDVRYAAADDDIFDGWFSGRVDGGDAASGYAVVFDSGETTAGVPVRSMRPAATAG